MPHYIYSLFKVNQSTMSPWHDKATCVPAGHWMLACMTDVAWQTATSMYCPSIVQVLSKYCPGIVQVLSSVSQQVHHDRQVKFPTKLPSSVKHFLMLHDGHGSITDLLGDSMMFYWDDQQPKDINRSAPDISKLQELSFVRSCRVSIKE